MVDISHKPIISREAVAEGEIILSETTLSKIRDGEIEKGDVLEASRLAAIMAVKRTPEIIPLCHPLKITSVEVTHSFVRQTLVIVVKVKAQERTGVEMEALTGLSVALLTVWDMCKQYEKDEGGNYPKTRINNIKILYKVKESIG